MAAPSNADAGSAICRRRASCRLCAGTDLALVLQLAPTPPANAFVPESALGRDEARFPLDVFLCRGCKHAQLLDVVDASTLFSEYVYVSGTSPVFVAHFRDYAADITRRLGLARDDRVVDIGSNDGTLLRFFSEQGQRVLGIDPAREIARRASESGIETWAEFFTPALAEKIVAERGRARAVTANNVFAHIDALGSVVDGVRTLLTDDGLFFFEVSYLVDVVDKMLFDTIYHEHLDYHTVGPLVGFFERHGMELVDAVRIDPHGGSLRGVAQRRGGPRPVAAAVGELAALERARGLDREETFVEFGRRIAGRGRELSELLGRLRASGKRVAGFGAPAKATTLMHHFGLDRHAIEFIADDSPLKQGLFTPGLHVPVLPSSALYERRPDFVVVLAWNFAPSIVKNHRRFVDEGGSFIVPLPELEVIGP